MKNAGISWIFSTHFRGFFWNFFVWCKVKTEAMMQQTYWVGRWRWFNIIVYSTIYSNYAQYCHVKKGKTNTINKRCTSVKNSCLKYWTKTFIFYFQFIQNTATLLPSEKSDTIKLNSVIQFCHFLYM